MKVKINATGEILDKPLREAQRLINRGIACIVKEVIKTKVRKKKKNESNPEKEEKLSSLEVESQEW